MTHFRVLLYCFAFFSLSSSKNKEKEKKKQFISIYFFFDFAWRLTCFFFCYCFFLFFFINWINKAIQKIIKDQLLLLFLNLKKFKKLLRLQKKQLNQVSDFFFFLVCFSFISVFLFLPSYFFSSFTLYLLLNMQQEISNLFPRSVNGPNSSVLALLRNMPVRMQRVVSFQSVSSTSAKSTSTTKTSCRVAWWNGGVNTLVDAHSNSKKWKSPLKLKVLCLAHDCADTTADTVHDLYKKIFFETEKKHIAGRTKWDKQKELPSKMITSLINTNSSSRRINQFYESNMTFNKTEEIAKKNHFKKYLSVCCFFLFLFSFFFIYSSVSKLTQFHSFWRIFFFISLFLLFYLLFLYSARSNIQTDVINISSSSSSSYPISFFLFFFLSSR